jgi:hypothetical protein
MSLIFLLLFPYKSMADWSWNLGYNNPPGATLGLNFMHLWTNWAFEVGLGAVQQSKGVDVSGKEVKSVSLLGDINMKYLFSSGTVRPYLMLGAGSAASVVQSNQTSVSAGIGGSYYGAGIFLMGNPFYVYLGYANGGGNGFPQVGLGFNF